MFLLLPSKKNKKWTKLLFLCKKTKKRRKSQRFGITCRGRSRAESPKRTHREVIVTFYRHPAIAVAKLNNKHNT